MLKVYEFDLNMTGEAVVRDITLRQNDSLGNTLKIKLKNGASDFALALTDAITLFCKKSDDTVVTIAVTGEDYIDVDTSEVEFALESQCLAATGLVTCCVQVQRGDAVATTSDNFYLYVEESIDDESAAASSDYTDLQALIASFSALTDVAASEAERVAAELLRASAEVSREDAEDARVVAENARVSAEDLRVTAEELRVTADSDRTDAEAARVIAEAARVVAESSRVSVEAARVVAESSRASAESGRTDAEGLRVTAEESRVSVEALRVTAELARASAEASRVAVEALRVTAESDRVSVEAARVTAEAARVTAEDLRVTAEGLRVAAEELRETAETGRVDAEDARVIEEAARVTAEDLRVTAEGLRVSAEEARVTAEGLRVSAEEARVTAESDRVDAEGVRVSSEDSRAAAEGLRVTAEAARVTAEGLRASAESARETAISNLVALGEYDPETTYEVNNTVSYMGSSYRCILQSTGNLPTNETYWVLSAQKGLDGEGSGDMLAVVYDPNSVEADAFSMDNMVEGNDKKIMSGDERTKLAGIEVSADVTDADNVASAIHGVVEATPENNDEVAIIDTGSSNVLKKVTWTNIKSFLKTYFDTLYNNYTHPSYDGDDFSVDTESLTGASVVSAIDINITTDESGHVVDANGSVSTRSLSLANLGYTGETDATKNSINNYTATIASTSWTGTEAPYTKTVTVTGITSEDIPIIDLNPTGTYATDIAMADSWANVYRITTATNAITVYAKEIPSVDISIILRVVK